MPLWLCAPPWLCAPAVEEGDRRGSARRGERGEEAVVALRAAVSSRAGSNGGERRKKMTRQVDPRSEERRVGKEC